MIEYKEIAIVDAAEIAHMYVETFNSPPWNDQWSDETAMKRLRQLINVEDFYGISAYEDKILCGMILGSQEQFFDGIMFHVKEFCVRNDRRGGGVGTALLEEFKTRLKQKGVRQIILFTSRDDGTEGFYKKRGLQSCDDMVMMSGLI